jgi:uncharacterized membrane protein
MQKKESGTTRESASGGPGNGHNEALAKARRAKFESTPKKKTSSGRSGSMHVMLFAIAAILVIGAGALFVLPALGQGAQTGASAAAASSAAPATTAPDGTIQIAASILDDNKAHFYAYDNKGQKIPYFVLKSSDGVVRAAFDACEVCYQAKKGYHQDGDEMVCNNCGRRFPSKDINVITGGCNPIPLKIKTGGGTVIINPSDIAADGASYF